VKQEEEWWRQQIHHHVISSHRSFFGVDSRCRVAGTSSQGQDNRCGEGWQGVAWCTRDRGQTPLFFKVRRHGME